MVARIWSNEKSCTLLVGMYNLVGKLFAVISLVNQLNNLKVMKS